MKYFNSKTLDELKAEYRRLAKENHPDLGGDTETMKEINAEFDLLFRIYEKKAPVKTYNSEPETAGEFRRKFYTDNGWEGSRYNPNLRLRDIAPIIRGYVKDVYPTWRFSVVQEHYSNGCSLWITLTEAPENIFLEDRIKAHPRREYSNEDAALLCRQLNASSSIQSWQWYYDWMTDKAQAVLKDIEVLVNSFRYDDSDAMFDYFSTNFYPHFCIGRWNKPLKIVPRMERIQTSKETEGARRISA
ncbi:MAG: hypothetical protein LBC76_08180 [Treponema sp.]|jgi:hypothetical protein|nr:hypothetical protein [Treponema sp.]